MFNLLYASSLKRYGFEWAAWISISTEYIFSLNFMMCGSWFVFCGCCMILQPSLYTYDLRTACIPYSHLNLFLVHPFYIFIGVKFCFSKLSIYLTCTTSVLSVTQWDIYLLWRTYSIILLPCWLSYFIMMTFAYIVELSVSILQQPLNLGNG